MKCLSNCQKKTKLTTRRKKKKCSAHQLQITKNKASQMLHKQRTNTKPINIVCGKWNKGISMIWEGASSTSCKTRSYLYDMSVRVIKHPHNMYFNTRKMLLDKSHLTKIYKWKYWTKLCIVYITSSLLCLSMYFVYIYNINNLHLSISFQFCSNIQHKWNENKCVCPIGNVFLNLYLTQIQDFCPSDVVFRCWCTFNNIWIVH